ncbi:MAG: type II toxin-antitoxin system Phd/YefM family antitoxin [Stenotrophobium sp.]
MWLHNEAVAVAEMRESTIREAKNTLTALIHEAESGKPVRLTRRGKPVAVLVSDVAYRRLQDEPERRRSFSSWLAEWRAGLPSGAEEISDKEVDTWRDRSLSGGRRDFSWGD